MFLISVVIPLSTDETETLLCLCRFCLPALEEFALKLKSLVSIWYRQRF